MGRNPRLRPSRSLLAEIPSMSLLLIQLISSFSYVSQNPLHGENKLELFSYFHLFV